MAVPSFSVFTPSHNGTWLGECLRSLEGQTNQDWEWIIVPNGDCRIQDRVRNHPQVKIVPAPKFIDTSSIGQLKGFACAQARGLWLVELDHDDLLHPECLAEIGKSTADFVYTDFVEFYQGGRSHTYGPEYGWVSYETQWKPEAIASLEKASGTWDAVSNFDLTSASLASIHYAPNHVRAWTREWYEKIGGHDPRLPEADDYDIVVRTWLSGARMECIRKPLYWYRLHDAGENSFIQRNAEIQRRNAELSNKYLDAIIREECRRTGRRMLDLGGAHGCPEGFESVDREGAAIECDITAGIPVDTDSVGWVRAHDFLEHLPPLEIPAFWNEIHRILAPGGWFTSMTPSTEGRGAWQDPTHLSGWNPNSFWYVTRAEQQKYVPEIKARFQAQSVFQAFPNQWAEQHNIQYVWARLIALKGQRQPGLVEI